jgi:hypothetical protein
MTCAPSNRIIPAISSDSSATIAVASARYGDAGAETAMGVANAVGMIVL